MDSISIPPYLQGQVAGLLSNTLALALTVLLVVAASFVIRAATSNPIPKISSSKAWLASRQDFATHGVDIIEKGFQQVKNGVFRVTGLDGSDLVLISPENWLALCKKKDHEVAPAREEFFLCNLTGAPFEDHFLYDYLYARMPAFDRYLDIMSEALDEGITEIIGPDSDYSQGTWKQIIFYPQILHAFSHLIWRVILRDQFSPDMVAIFEKYSATLIPAMKNLKAKRPIFARISAAFSNEVKQVDMQLDRATEVLMPLFEQALRVCEEGQENGAHGVPDMILELVKQAPANRRRDFKYLTNILVGFAFTFVFSPGPSATQIIYEFAFRPNYADLVRQEVLDNLGQPENWSFSRESLRKLTLLDSFCKETHKHHPTAASNLMKKIHQTQTLPNGVVLPAGTVFEVVMTAAHRANPSFENPSEWNGHRYHELRKGGSNKYEWGAATRDDVNFGYASHMCPGRFAGCAMVKMLLIKLLTRCDVRQEDGETERYQDIYSGQYISPNPNKHILLRPRKDVRKELKKID